MEAETRHVLSLLCPTRGRPENVRRLVESVEESAAFPGRVEILFYVDSDDPRLGDYLEFFAHAPIRHSRLLRVQALCGEPKSVSLSWNDIARECTGDVLLMANDDQVYGHAGWDVRLDREIRRFPDQIYCIWFNDGINGEAHCAFPIVSRRWYETLGYFTPGIFEFLFNDTWIMHIALLLDRLHYVGDVLVEHLHQCVGKAPKDETYARHGKERVLRDQYLFQQTAPIRRRDATLLYRIMDKGKSVNTQVGEIAA